MASFRDWVVELSNTTGFGDYFLIGRPPSTSYFAFRDRHANGANAICFYVRNKDRTKWEKNRFSTLTYFPDKLTRNVVESSNGDAPISWTADDLPLAIYAATDSDVLDGAITGWLSAARSALLRFGQWFQQDDPSSGKHAWKIFDGTADIDVGVIDTVNHTIALKCMPAGAILPYAGATAPDGFLLCYGQVVSRTTYAALFEAIGTIYGVGDGSTTFALPDLRGRVVAGQDDMGGSSANRLTSPIDGDTLGATGGAEAIALVATNLPELLLPAGTGVPGNQTPRGVFGDGTNAGTIPIAGTNPGSTGVAHQNTQPTIVLNYLIKA